MRTHAVAVAVATFAFTMPVFAQTTSGAVATSPPAVVGPSKTWAIKDEVIRRGDGIPAVYLENGTFTLTSLEKKQVFVLDWESHNDWQCDFNCGFEDLKIVGYDKSGKEYPLLKISYFRLMENCYRKGTVHYQAGRLKGPPLADVLVDVRFIVEPVRGRIGPC